MSDKPKMSFATIKKKLETNWSKPNPGEYLTIKEISAYTFAQIGSAFFMTMLGYLTFSASYFCGAIMGIQFMDFYKIGLLGTILGYILIFMNPFGVLIYENHGKLKGNTKLFAFLAYSLQLLAGIVCYTIPIDLLENVPRVGMIALPQILGNLLTIGAFSNFANWFVRSKFCAKYGRIKPFIILYGIPATIILCVIPYLPITESSYATKLIVLHFAFSFLGYFMGSYNQISNLVTFMTPNSQERQRLYSFVPIVTGIAPSLIIMFLPMLINKTGGFTELRTYQIFTPIFTITGMVITFSALLCKERIIENKNEKRPTVTFWKGAKQVLKNKYLWITNISGPLGVWANIFNSILQWWFVYSLRMEWFAGVAANIVVLSMTFGNLLTPMLTRKFQKKNLLIASRTIAVFTICLMYFSISINSIVLFMLAMFLRNGIAPVENGVFNGLNADIMDYHQWRFGERADSMAGVFSWFLSPLTMVLGFVLPALLKSAGFTSDWDILYNQSVIQKVFSIHVVLSIISTIAFTLPFIFYDLTREKHQQCVEELRQRLIESGEKDNEMISAMAEKEQTDNLVEVGYEESY